MMSRIFGVSIAVSILISGSSLAAIFDPAVEDRFPIDEARSSITRKVNYAMTWAAFAGAAKAAEQDLNFTGGGDQLTVYVEKNPNHTGNFSVSYSKSWFHKLSSKQDPNKYVYFYFHFYPKYRCDELARDGGVFFDCRETGYHFSYYITTPPPDTAWGETLQYIREAHTNWLGENSRLREALPAYITQKMTETVLSQDNIVPVQTDEELLTCRLSTPQYKKFCTLHNAPTTSKEMPRTIQVGGVVFDIYDLFQRYNNNDLGEYAQLAHKMDVFTPQLKFQLVWSDLPACWPNGLTSNELKIYDGNGSVMGNLYVGYDQYAFNLNAGVNPLWVATTQGMPEDKFAIRSDSYYIQDYSTPNIYYHQRIPKECVLGMNDRHLGFDTDEILRDTMPSLADKNSDLNELMADKIVFHGGLLADIAGSQCAVYQVTKALLRSVELATNIDVKTNPAEVIRELRSICYQNRLGDIYLSFMSAMSRANSQGTLPGSPKPHQYTEYYADNYNLFVDACTRSGIMNYIPNEAVFADFSDPIKTEGINNARRYKEKAAEQHRVLTIAWAIAVAAEVQFQQTRDYWMIPTFQEEAQ